MPLLEVKNLHARVAAAGGKEILKGVDLTINRGEVHAIMGKNGSGKSTLAQVIMGRETYEVTDGQILYDGKNLAELSAVLRAARLSIRLRTLRRLLSALLLIGCAVSVTGCGVKLAYNNLDRFIRWSMDDYMDLDAKQDAFFKAELERPMKLRFVVLTILAGIGGAVAATVGRLLQSLARRRQVMCVTHLPQVAAFADAHFRVTKRGDDDAVRTDVAPLGAAERVEELARMHAGEAITARTRAHARELLAQARRPAP